MLDEATSALDADSKAIVNGTRGGGLEKQGRLYYR
jgi:ABC-type multidrug transport system fused ATPase/permease subunit